MEDLIRRRDALEAWDSKPSVFCRNIKDIPAAEPTTKVVAQINIDEEDLIRRIKEEYALEPKRGHWIELEGPRIQCSACKRKIVWTGHGILKHPRFCPNCGADMRGEKQ